MTGVKRDGFHRNFTVHTGTLSHPFLNGMTEQFKRLLPRQMLLVHESESLELPPPIDYNTAGKICISLLSWAALGLLTKMWHLWSSLQRQMCPSAEISTALFPCIFKHSGRRQELSKQISISDVESQSTHIYRIGWTVNNSSSTGSLAVMAGFQLFGHLLENPSIFYHQKVIHHLLLHLGIIQCASTGLSSWSNSIQYFHLWLAYSNRE